MSKTISFFVIGLFAIPFFFKIEIWPFASYRMYMWYKQSRVVEVVRLAECDDQNSYRLIEPSKYWANVFMYNLLPGESGLNSMKMQEAMSSSQWKRLVSPDLKVCFVSRTIELTGDEVNLQERILW